MLVCDSSVLQRFRCFFLTSGLVRFLLLEKSLICLVGSFVKGLFVQEIFLLHFFARFFLGVWSFCEGFVRRNLWGKCVI